MGKDVIIYPVFVPMIGCPHQCAFCNQRSITGRSISNLIEDIKNQIDTIMGTAVKREGYKEIAFFGGSFTCLSIELQNTILSLAHPYLKTGMVDGIRISTRPDYIAEPILENLLKKGLTTIELGIQSTNSHVLEASERGYTYEKILPDLLNLRNYPFKVGYQMMTGLPYDTRLISIKTALDFAKIKPDFVRIYPTLVVKGSTLEQQFYQGKYKPLTIEEAVDWVKDIKFIFEYHDIEIIRIGLQAQEGFDKGQDLVAGPYHPAFGELVESAIYRAWMKDILQSIMVSKKNISDKSIIFQVHPSRLSQAIGQKKSNIKYLSQEFPHYNISIKPNKEADEQEVIVAINGKIEKHSRKTHIARKYEGILKEIWN